jgi:type IX secretion system PorP/SprF family membrane protein
MKIYKNISVLLVALGLLMTAKTSFGQDPEFTQFYSNPLYLNPAFAGSKVCPRVSLNSRNQWANLSGSFVTYSASYDQMVPSISGGLGLLVMTDNAAQTMKTTRVSGMYAYNQAVTRKFSINVGVEATFFQKSIDWDKLTFGDMIDPRRGFVYETNDVRREGAVTGIDFSAGAIGYTENFFFGFAAHHVTEPEESLIKDQSELPMKLTGHAGAIIPLGGGSKYNASDASVSPNILFRQQGTFTQLNMGVYIKKGPLTGGIWYRNQDAFITSIGIETDFFKIGYSYDVTVSKLSLASGGSHELSMGLNFSCRPKKPKFRTISCPSF